MDIQHTRTRNRSVAFDDPVTDFYIDLPSGRRLFFSSLPDGPYDSDEDAEKNALKRKQELLSMLDEYYAERDDLEALKAAL